MREPIIGDGGRPLPRPAPDNRASEVILAERRAERDRRVREREERRTMLTAQAAAAVGRLHELAKGSDNHDAVGGGRIWVRTARAGARDGCLDFLAIGTRPAHLSAHTGPTDVRLDIQARWDDTGRSGWMLFIDDERVSLEVASEAVASVLVALEDWSSDRDEIPF